MYIQNPGQLIKRELPSGVYVIIPHGRRRFDEPAASLIREDPVLMSLHSCGAIIMEADFTPPKEEKIVKARNKKKKN